VNCKEARAAIQELVDGLEGAGEARGHLAGCPSCRKAFSGLSSAGRSLAALRLFAPSAVFRSRVLSAMAPATPPWARWSAGAALSLTSFWAAALAMAAIPRLGILLRLAADPDLMRLRIIEAWLPLAGALDRASAGLQACATQEMFWRLAASTLMSGAILALAFGDCATRQWRKQ
jgi:hypothetical protein